MAAFSIRTASLEDIPTIHDLAHRTWPDTFGGILSPDQITYMLDMMYSEQALHEQMTVLGHLYFLGFDDEGSAQGYAGYQFDYLPGTTKLHKIYVLPEGQKHGSFFQLSPKPHTTPASSAYASMSIIKMLLLAFMSAWA